MTVAAMRREMSEPEYQYWRIYHARRAQRAELEQQKATARQHMRRR